MFVLGSCYLTTIKHLQLLNSVCSRQHSEADLNPFELNYPKEKGGSRDSRS